ncbi:ABC transporter ATP-binding protein [Vreelandella hamiltonii]|uniref:ABC transporter ATP-binding protein n=1 Tax=Vreelandella hamiltonii TaxID=502829 RepID=A0A8H9I4H4_9GAMM|nr:ABC transporter ATP-binding protein [Halomonas hamiltonii]ATH79403.1 ABC transporter ATP-binding protein [Halomonas hydrothermalis]GGW33663.1 ABC transporter ATP-binding protein [Halomonas hamiltonii]
MSYSSDPTSKVPSDAANAHPPITDTLTSDKVPPAMAPNVVLHAHQLAKRVASGERSLTILDNLDLSVAAGESVAILGKSGAGKSTLLGLLAGLDTPSDGELTLFGHPLSQLDEDGRAALRAGRVGFVFQNFQLLPTLSAFENVLLPLELSPRAGETAAAQQWLERVGLGERTSHLPKQLSGGEQQRVAIARAFVTDPELVFADEPTGNLDPDTGAQIIDLLFTLNQQAGTTLILVTHDHALARRCDRCLRLTNGQLTPFVPAPATSEEGNE